MTSVTTAAAFSALRGQTPAPDPRGKGAAEAAKQFEQILAFELLKTMRATVPSGDGEAPGFASSAIDGMFDQAIAEATAGRLGVAPMLEAQLGPRDAEASGPGQGLAAATTRPISLPPTEALAEVPSATTPSAAAFGGALPLPGDTPVQGRVSSDYGWRTHPITGDRKFHGGMDIAAAEGTEIHAAQRGTVTFSGRRPGYGKVVEIRHPDGTTGRYAHASRLHVDVGDRVDAGEAIADVGETGQATGPHLHFEVRKNGHPIDPERWLSGQRKNRPDPARTGIR